MATDRHFTLPPTGRTDRANPREHARSKAGMPPAGLRVLVVGLGRFGGGVGVTRWLTEQGAAVTVTDRAAGDELADSIDAVADLDVDLHLGGHDPSDLDEADLVVINPAVVKSTSQFFQLIERRAIPWTTEINLFCERCPCPIIGVTGSYGKSTTCAMLAEVLRACHHADVGARRDSRTSGGSDRLENRSHQPDRSQKVCYTGVHLGGNIGRSLLSDLPDIRPTDLVVLELSNAQLEDLPRIGFFPPLAVITNLWPHHLDRYGTFAAYARAKLNIVCDPDRASKLVVGDMADEAAALLEQLLPDHADRVVRVRSFDPPLALRVPGAHNQANAACVATMCHHLGLEEQAVREALAAFTGLPHRLQHVRTLDGVDYYNDSKSTSPDATETAIAAFDRPTRAAGLGSHGRLVAIVGGQDKGVSLTKCADRLAATCTLVICVGESGRAWTDALQAGARAGACRIVHEPGKLDGAVSLARKHAKPGGAVLFSPGAPSFDRYPNFARRGEHFIELVNALG